MTTRYLDPKNNLAFKKVFGAEKHKSIPIDFLNAVFHLEGDDKIIDLDFLNLRQTPEIDARKESIVDVLVKDQRGTKYVVEMQVAKVEGIEKSAQYYAAKTYCAHFKIGEEYQNLKKVVFLAITDYIVFPKKEGYKSDHVILDHKSYEHDLKDFSFTFVELPKFNKKLKDLQTIEDQWYYFLKYADESNNIAEILAHNPEIQQAYEILDRYHWTESELQYYEKLIMNAADAKGVITAAKNEGRREGHQEGLQEGIQKGRQEGLQEGVERGRFEMARKMIERGLPLDEIVQITGLPEDDIKSFQTSLLPR